MDYTFKKTYTNSLQYIDDMAKTSGAYDEVIGSNSQVGFEYKYWLANKKQDENWNPDELRKVDTSFLNAADAFNKLKLATGDMKEDDFYSLFGDNSANIKKAFKTSDEYFDYQRDLNINTIAYNNLSNAQKWFRDFGTVLLDVALEPAAIIEGIIDAALTIAGFVSGNANNWASNLIKKDLLGDDTFKQQRMLAKYGSNKMSAGWRFVDNLLINIEDMALNAILYVGPALYWSQMSGKTMEGDIQAGTSFYSAVVHTGLELGVEFVTEKIFGGMEIPGVENKFFDKGLISWAPATTWYGRLGQAMIKEGTEEIAAEIIETPLDKAFKHEKWNTKEYFTNIAVSGLMGALTGGIMEIGGQMRAGGITAVTNLMFAAEGQHISRAASMSFRESISEVRNAIDQLNKNGLENFRTSNNLSAEDMAKLAKGEGDPKMLKDYEKANKAEQAKSQIEDLITGAGNIIADMINKIGPEKFTSAMKDWSNTVSNVKANQETKTAAAKNIGEFVVSSKELHYDAMTRAGVSLYNSAETSTTTFNVSIDPTTVNNKTLGKMRQVMKQKFGIDVVFGKFIDKKTNATDANKTIDVMTVSNKDGGGKRTVAMIDIDTYKTMSPENFVKQVLAQDLCSTLVDENILNKEAIKELRSILPKDSGEKLSDVEIMSGLLSDPTMLCMLYGLDKKASRKVISSIENKGENAKDKISRQYYNNLAARLVKNIETIKDLTVGEGAVKNSQYNPKSVESKDPLCVYFNEEDGSNISAIGTISVDAYNKGYTIKSDAMIFEPFYWTDAFIDELRVKTPILATMSNDEIRLRNYEDTLILKALNNWLYDNYNHTFVPYVGMSTVVDTFDVVNDLTDKIKNGDKYDIKLDEVLIDKLVNRFNVSEELKAKLREKLHNIEITVDESETRTYGESIDDDIYIYGKALNSTTELKTALAHELSHQIDDVLKENAASYMKLFDNVKDNTLIELFGPAMKKINPDWDGNVEDIRTTIYYADSYERKAGLKPINNVGESSYITADRLEYTPLPNGEVSVVGHGVFSGVRTKLKVPKGFETSRQLKDGEITVKNTSAIQKATEEATNIKDLIKSDNKPQLVVKNDLGGKREYTVRNKISEELNKLTYKKLTDTYGEQFAKQTATLQFNNEQWNISKLNSFYKEYYNEITDNDQRTNIEELIWGMYNYINEGKYSNKSFKEFKEELNKLLQNKYPTESFDKFTQGNTDAAIIKRYASLESLNEQNVIKLYKTFKADARNTATRITNVSMTQEGKEGRSEKSIEDIGAVTQGETFDEERAVKVFGSAKNIVDMLENISNNMDDLTSFIEDFVPIFSATTDSDKSSVDMWKAIGYNLKTFLKDRITNLDNEEVNKKYLRRLVEKFRALSKDVKNKIKYDAKSFIIGYTSQSLIESIDQESLNIITNKRETGERAEKRAAQTKNARKKGASNSNYNDKIKPILESKKITTIEEALSNKDFIDIFSSTVDSEASNKEKWEAIGINLGIFSGMPKNEYNKIMAKVMEAFSDNNSLVDTEILNAFEDGLKLGLKKDEKEQPQVTKTPIKEQVTEQPATEKSKTATEKKKTKKNLTAEEAIGIIEKKASEKTNKDKETSDKTTKDSVKSFVNEITTGTKIVKSSILGKYSKSGETVEGYVVYAEAIEDYFNKYLSTIKSDPILSLNAVVTEFKNYSNEIMDRFDIQGQAILSNIYMGLLSLSQTMLDSEDAEIQSVKRSLMDEYIKYSSSSGYSLKSTQVVYANKSALKNLLEELLKQGATVGEQIDILQQVLSDLTAEEREAIKKPFKEVNESRRKTRKNIQDEINNKKTRQNETIKEIEQILNTMKDLKGATKVIKDIKSFIESSKALNRDINIKTAEIERLKEQLNNSVNEAEIKQYNDRIKELENDKNTLEKNLQDQIEQLKAENQDLNTQIDNITALQSENAKLQEEIDKLNKKLIEENFNEENKILNAISKGDWEVAFKEIIYLIDSYVSNGKAIPEKYKIYKDIYDKYQDKIILKSREMFDKLPKNKGEKIYNFLYNLRYMSMLSKPATWVRNSVTNGLMSVLSSTSSSLARVLQDTKLTAITLNKGDFDFWEKTENGFTIYSGTTLNGETTIKGKHQYVLASSKEYSAADRKYLNTTKFTDEKVKKIFNRSKYADSNETTNDSGKGITKEKIEKGTPTGLRKIGSILFDKAQKVLDFGLNVSDARWGRRYLTKLYSRVIAGNKDYICQESVRLYKEEYDDLIKIKEDSDRYEEAVQRIDDILLAVKMLGYQFKDKKIERFNDNVSNIDVFQYIHYSLDQQLIGDFSDAPKKSKEVYNGVLDDMARVVLFKNDNKVGDWYNKLRSKHPLAASAIGFLGIPFPRMAYNLTSRFLEYTPVGFLSFLKDRNKFKKYATDLYNNLTANKDFQKALDETSESLAIYSIESYNDLKQEIERLSPIVNELSDEDSKRYEALLSIKHKLESIMGSRNLTSKNIKKVMENIKGFEQYSLADKFSKATVGTILMVMGSLLALTGIVSVDDDDYMGPVINVAGFKLRFSDLAPVTSSFAVGVNFTNLIQKGGTESAWGQFIDGILEDTMFNFATDIIEYADNPFEAMINLAANGITQYFPNFIKGLNAVIQDNKKQKSTSMFIRFWENIVDQSIFKFFLPNKIDPYTGKVIKANSGANWVSTLIEALNFVSPIKIKYRKKSKIQLEAEKIGAMTSGASNKIKLPSGKTIRLSNAQAVEFKKYRAQYIKKYLNSLIKSGAYKSANKQDKQALIKKLYSKATKIAQEKYIKAKKLH